MTINQPKLNQQQKIAIVIAVIMLSITCAVAVIKDVAELSLIIFILIGFFLGMLSFLIVGNITGSGEVFGLNFSSVGGGFAVFVVVMVSYFILQKDVFTIMKKDSEVLKIEDPSDIKIWEKASGEYKWFNAPYAYAAGSHLPTKFEWFKNPNFHLELLLFDSTDPKMHESYFKPRFKGMVDFLRGLERLNQEQSANINLKNQITVKYYLSSNIPTVSFFTTRNASDGDPYSIIYMTDKANNRRVTECLTTESEKINITLTEDFESYWGGDCVEVDIDEILNPNNNLDSLINRL